MPRKKKLSSDSLAPGSSDTAIAEAPPLSPRQRRDPPPEGEGVQNHKPQTRDPKPESPAPAAEPSEHELGALLEELAKRRAKLEIEIEASKQELRDCRATMKARKAAIDQEEKDIQTRMRAAGARRVEVVRAIEEAQASIERLKAKAKQ